MKYALYEELKRFKQTEKKDSANVDCDKCKYTTNKRKNLREHIKSMHNNIRYQCLTIQVLQKAI